MTGPGSELVEDTRYLVCLALFGVALLLCCSAAFVGHVARLLISGSIDFLWPRAGGGRPDLRLSVINKDFQVVSRLRQPLVAFFYGRRGSQGNENRIGRRGSRQITDFNNVAQVD